MQDEGHHKRKLQTRLSWVSTVDAYLFDPLKGWALTALQMQTHAISDMQARSNAASKGAAVSLKQK